MGLSFINGFRAPVSICLLWYNPACSPPWRKTGWWNLAPGQSVQVLSGALNSRYYYFHAIASDSSYWGEPGRQILVTNSRFDTCLNGILEPSYNVAFKEIDTGPYSDYALTLTA